MKRTLATTFIAATFALALAVPVYVAFRDDRRDRSAYVGWRSGDFVYETSARFLGWRFGLRLDVPRRDSIPISDPAAARLYSTMGGPGSYPHGGFDSYPLGSGGQVLGEEPQWLGFGGALWAPPATHHRVYTLWVPVWFVVIVLALPGARWIARRHVAVSRVREGRCEACGYDLRGAAHDRCPECGRDALTRPESATDRRAQVVRPASGPP